MVTRFPSGQEIARKWHVVDGSGQTLGRLASRVARILAGKENPNYTPFLDTGDLVDEAALEGDQSFKLKRSKKVRRKRPLLVIVLL